MRSTECHCSLLCYFPQCATVGGQGVDRVPFQFIHTWSDLTRKVMAAETVGRLKFEFHRYGEGMIISLGMDR